MTICFRRHYPEGELLVDKVPDPYGMEPCEDLVAAYEARIRKNLAPSFLDCGERHTAVITTMGELYGW